MSARIKPQVRDTETYTEPNFLRLHTARERDAARAGALVVTLEHLCYRPADGGEGGWRCRTIVDAEPMSKADALFIARAYAKQNDVPVIYACHAD